MSHTIKEMASSPVIEEVWLDEDKDSEAELTQFKGAIASLSEEELKEKKVEMLEKLMKKNKTKGDTQVGSDETQDMDSDGELYNFEEVNSASISEAKLKEKEMDLLEELMESEADKKKEETQFASNFENLQKENLQLRKLLAEKDAKCAKLLAEKDTLTQREATVCKNICSLYKTAKMEIDYKNSLLAENNRKLDSILYRRNMTLDQLDKQSSRKIEKNKPNEDKNRELSKERKTESGVPNKTPTEDKEKSLKQTSAKRKRPSSPTGPNKTPKTELSNRSPKNNSNTKSPATTDSSYKKQNESNSIQITTSNQGHSSSTNKNKGQKKRSSTSSGQGSGKRPSMEEVFFKMQEMAFKDPATTNEIFLNLLPEELKESFCEYERSQMEAMNKLKQTFVRSYFSHCCSGLESSGNGKNLFFFKGDSSKCKPQISENVSGAKKSSL